MAVDEILAGPRILLRAPRVDDAEDLFASVTSDPRVTEFLSWTPHPDIAETRRVIRELFNVGDDHTWVIVLRDSGQVVGQLGCRRPRPDSAEMGYCIGAPWWGSGLMTEAVTVALQWLQLDPHLRRVTATVHPANARSARVLEKCGFALEGMLVRHTVFPNLRPEPQDCLLYARVLG
ncbi:MAG: GNAT family N-acetyltransferase [Mycobacteriaceae bacterium]|nr:GNAT family N-acetyltransferase [Mycobacteriaceae bacterium]